ncbi:MAG: alginate lyase family protein [Saprospiraceae bacterium]|nr:alginate lyase family protein [Saprospiraceae bacterium]
MSLILKYFYTIRYLHIKQLIYFLKYRIADRIFHVSGSYRRYQGINFRTHFVDLNFLPVRTKILKLNQLEIFHLKKEYAKLPDWNDRDQGKLWNYQLQYLDFLLDKTLDTEIQITLLKDISDKINSGQLLLEPFPVSLRLIHIWAGRPRFQDFDKGIQTAYQKQLEYLELHPEYHLSGNHLLINYIALCYGFQALGNSARLQHYLKILMKEIQRQILPDGAHYERSLSYHLDILGYLTGLYLILKETKECETYRDQLYEKCKQMFDWIMYVTHHLKIVPLFNDCIRLDKIIFEKLSNYYNNNLDVGKTYELKESGYRKLSNASCLCIVNAGNITATEQPGHQHADMLHFCLNIHEKDVLVDTGISTYEVSPERLLQRASASHNVVVGCQDQNQSELWASFRMARRACLEITEDFPDRLSAKVKWYQGHVHQRKFSLQENELRIEDQFDYVKNSSERSLALFHFDHVAGDLKVVEQTVVLEKTGIKFNFDGAREIKVETYQQNFNFCESVTAQRILVYFYGCLQTRISWSS